ncbi:MAG TPA: hypothetical protein VGE52_10765 [Pirellulales bacterium]
MLDLDPDEILDDGKPRYRPMDEWTFAVFGSDRDVIEPGTQVRWRRKQWAVTAQPAGPAFPGEPERLLVTFDRRAVKDQPRASPRFQQWVDDHMTRGPMAALGLWPGDESDEEILRMLREMG